MLLQGAIRNTLQLLNPHNVTAYYAKVSFQQRVKTQNVSALKNQI